ncbi:MAG: DUF47 family protein [Planctomycetes bacterium]|nr:DUF47 family protein [Planctomycetota bacterium]
MGLQAIIRFLLPKEDQFYDFLEQQAKAAHLGAEALAKFTQGEQAADEARKAVQICEHDGDASVHAMEEALAKTFVTPIDREDLQKLSSELDTVLDLTNGAIRACTMLGVDTPTEPMKKLVSILVDCTVRIDAVMPKLRQHGYGDIVACSRELRKIEKEADSVYREAISSLFKDSSVDAKKLIREKTVLEDLENAIDQRVRSTTRPSRGMAMAEAM